MGSDVESVGGAKQIAVDSVGVAKHCCRIGGWG